MLMQQLGDDGLALNGQHVSLGTVGDVADELTARGRFALGVSLTGDREILYTCQIQNKAALVAPYQFSQKLAGRVLGRKDRNEFGFAEYLNQLGANYISTERIGPRETYEANTTSSLDRRFAIGARGEHTAWVLNESRDEQIPEALCRREVPPNLFRQAEAWLGVFFPGAGLEVKRIEGANLLTMRIRTHPQGNFHRPQNVGYGLTHILPIIVGALVTSTGFPFVVENPETHLHPSAQAQMGKFLAQVAAAGRQVIIESHSDHILNGIRRAVKERVLGADDVKIHFFNRRPTSPEHPPQVISPQLNQDGRIDHWPKGFFDQFETDLDALTTWD